MKEEEMIKRANKLKKGWEFIDNGKGIKIIKQPNKEVKQ